MLIVRRDGRSLRSKQVWALSEYMQSVSGNFVGLAGPDNAKKRREVVTKLLNWKAFDSYLEKFMVEKMIAGGKSWANVSSPLGAKQDAS